MAGQKSPAYVLGVGMTKFVKPRGAVDYPELGFEAAVKALLDAGVGYDVDQAVACYCYGDSTCGQRVVYQLGMTQIPVYNVNNNCATGPSGLALARSLVVGFEKMAPGSLRSHFGDRASPTATSVAVMAATRGVDAAAPGPGQLFGNAGREYMERHGAAADDFAEIARVNHAHSAANPYAQFRRAYSLDEVRAAPAVFAPLTKLQCCPTSDGGAAAAVVSRAFLDARPGLRARAVEVAGLCMATDPPGLFSRSATGLAQCAELVWHLRGWANNRAAPRTRHCLQHNLGLGGAVVVAVYRRADGAEAPVVDSDTVGRLTGLGYNPAVEAKGFTAEQAASVRSRRAPSQWALQGTLEKVQARF